MSKMKMNVHGFPPLVSKYTRAGKKGRAIVCPNCNAKHKVSHFSWTVLTCMSCFKDIDKEDWTVALTDKEKYTGKTSIYGNGIVMKEVNTKMIQDSEVMVNTSDYPDFADSYFERASWVDGSELTEEELEYLENDGDYLYECCEKSVF